MIYLRPCQDAPVDQGDIIDRCPIASVIGFNHPSVESVDWEIASARIIDLTQTCDLANQKADLAAVSVVYSAAELVSNGLLKRQDVRGPIRAGRVYGWYFLPKCEELELPEMLVDLRQLYSIPVVLLTELCRQDHRPARLADLYRAHLAKHFADTYSRIGLPEPYETDPE